MASAPTSTQTAAVSTETQTESQASSDHASEPNARLDDDTTQRLAKVFKALGDPARVQLLSLIAANTAGEMCLCDLTAPVGLSQPTVSHHMKVLVEAGLATREQRGRWAYYRPNLAALEAAAGAFTRRQESLAAAALQGNPTL